MQVDPLPVVLEATHVKLEPLALEHAPQLLIAAAYPEIWRWMPFDLSSEEQMRSFIEIAMRKAEAKSAFPLALLSKAANRAIGNTGFWNIEARHLRLDIGGTWITPEWQRTAVNTEMKYLMLRHAFEVLRCRRVGFAVDSLNVRSQTALRRIGAKQEGILRNHIVQPDGRKRHSVSFSVIDDEWPEVKARLEGLLNRPSGAGQKRTSERS